MPLKEGLSADASGRVFGGIQRLREFGIRLEFQSVAKLAQPFMRQIDFMLNLVDALFEFFRCFWAHHGLRSSRTLHPASDTVAAGRETVNVPLPTPYLFVGIREMSSPRARVEVRLATQ